ncbi:hypothetical protein [Pseudoalteromonas luteoviolacea]|uniref:DUF4345 domain-containing protein n=1 Tax=Pseudoalteromonas luteoviolacea S4054 TaxID=1129367 RepID=A0A0F6A7K8_9GAMM|nr:hypothetical protein [Pseudoalteromonas luteoviolacea]AOT07632.1 hypothetical protein S4054249_07155 [Pseudoalteromonas luteoviolacea]AOT12548.1 hypothetical protein S40542_07155 [Pseudoalteromonas luteoviolacea]AOT17462.1 hypothetical protein S4054_07155 [Pseudoalteromonas luteoviolacea]KKE81374.1 hypothetical protein N479_22840 [Pseudoalteromonas luteoviolacea S4054]KZN70617.1 hypothetical protein N481_20590 [Pseudoalteromonas luteoviolacea S4047-1]
MIKFAQVLCGIFVLILGSAALTAMLFPSFINEPSGFNAVTDYGLTNLRTLGAPTLSLAIITAIGIYKKAWLLILPASMYFFFNFIARVISTIVEGYDPVMLFGLLFTFTLFLSSQVALQIFRKAD